MKHLVFSFFDTQEYKKARAKAAKKKFKSQLIQVFCGIREKKKIYKVLKKLKKDFPQAIIIGATTAGEIIHANMQEQSIVVSLSLFEKTKIRHRYVPEIDTDSAHTISNEIFTKNTKAAIVLSEGLYGKDYEGFIRELRGRYKEVIISGGMAGDNFLLEKTYIFSGEQIYDHGAVSVSFSSKNLFAKNHYNLNWEPIGKQFMVTEVEKNLVHRIDNLSAVDFFKKYLGEDVFQENGKSLPDFQLLFKEGDTYVSRTPMTREGDALVFAAPLRKGQKVQFGFSNAASVLSGSEYISKKLDTQPAEGIFIYSCIARKTLIGKLLEKEFSSFEAIAPTAGFFTYGEFYSTEADNALLNCTTTILVLSENKKTKGVKKAKKRLKNVDMTLLENVTFNALTHFIKQTSIELDENIRLMNQYQNVVDASSLVSKTDIHGNITYVNDNFCRISEYTKEELLGKPHNIVRDKKVPAKIFKQMWETIQSSKVWKGTFSNRSKTGKRYYVDATVMPIFDANARIVEYIAIRQDITKQVLAKKRIQEKEKLIKAIFDNQDNVVVLASKETGMKNVNKKFFEYFNYESFEDFKAQHTCICDLFIHEEGYVNPQDMPEWLERIAADDTKDYKVKIRAKDGTIRIFNIKIRMVEDDYIINLNDITNLEEALLKAYASEQAKSVFLANMSHEIRTPLNGILGFTDLLMQKELESEVRKYIEIIHKSGKTLLNVVNDILDFSKLESGEFSLHEVPTNLYEELEASVSTFSSLSKTKKVNYFAYVDTHLPKQVQCDSQRIKQVLNNLISNAIKFTPEGGDVKVCISVKEQTPQSVRVHFSVKDTGVGIEKEKLTAIFDAFSQEDNSISREFGGTGLGLSISNQFIEMMGSKIEVKSEKGKGSEFYFDLEFPVIDTAFSLDDKKPSLHELHVGILKQTQQEECQVLDIVRKYLDEWNLAYTEFDSLRDMPRNLDVLISYAPFVDGGFCTAILESNERLKIIYVENVHDSLVCNHERFLSISQPMTGSDLFNALLTSVHIEKELQNYANTTQEQDMHYKGKILVAEDNVTNQMLIGALLEARGIAYDIVNNGAEAVEMLTQKDAFEYDLVFMDINMPVMDGITATQKLRDSDYEGVIVSLSANVIESDTQRFKEAGMNDTLNKPIVPQELDAILEKYLQKEDEVSLEFDTIDVQQLTQELAIKEQVILALLRTLQQSFQDALAKLEAGELDKSLAHSIKGVAGNMRLHHLHTFAAEVEQKVEDATIEQRKYYIEVLKEHLQRLLEAISVVLAGDASQN